jgi:hypothetical protein
LGQHIEVFHKLQIECGITEPLKILLHSNVQWGSAYLMLTSTYKFCEVSPFCFSLFPPLTAFCQPINLFISTADQWYGPITTICCEGHILKHIPWTAFATSKNNWERVKEVSEILLVRLDHLIAPSTKLTSIITGF